MFLVREGIRYGDTFEGNWRKVVGFSWITKHKLKVTSKLVGVYKKKSWERKFDGWTCSGQLHRQEQSRNDVSNHREL